MDCFCILHDFVKRYKIGNRDNNTYKTWSRRTIKKIKKASLALAHIAEFGSLLSLLLLLLLLLCTRPLLFPFLSSSNFLLFYFCLWVCLPSLYLPLDFILSLCVAFVPPRLHLLFQFSMNASYLQLSLTLTLPFQVARISNLPWLSLAKKCWW